MKILSGLFIFLMSFQVFADYSLNIHLTSEHFIDRNDGVKWNEKNYGLGLQKTKGKHSLGVGYFKNSYHKDSFYIATSYNLVNYQNFKLGGTVGIVSGYEDYNPPFILGFNISYKNVFLLLAPAHVSLSLNFN